MDNTVSVEKVLDVVAAFDGCGGASLGLVAWDLFVPEEAVAAAWDQARDQRLIHPAGFDGHEQLWRLTVRGWHTLSEPKSA